MLNEGPGSIESGGIEPVERASLATSVLRAKLGTGMGAGRPFRAGRILTSVLTLVLWAATSAVSIVEVSLLTDVAVALHLQIRNDPNPGRAAYQAASVGKIAVALVGIAAGVFVIVTGEYHHRNLGKRKSWVLFAGTIAMQAAIWIAHSFV